MTQSESSKLDQLTLAVSQQSQQIGQLVPLIVQNSKDIRDLTEEVRRIAAALEKPEHRGTFRQLFAFLG